MVLLLPLLAGLAAAVPRSPGTPTPTPSLAPTCQPNGQLPAQTPIDFHFSGNVRKYYVAAEEVDWDYAPSGWDNWLSVPVHKSPRADDAGYNDVPSLGTKWRKAVYRGYTDATFSKRTPQPAWQGLQGPTIRAEVGDMVEILFVNRMPTHYASMHSMGLAYTKNNEGAIYERSNMTVTGDAVPPGGCWVYKWVAPESAAPNHGEPATMHGYHSYVSIQEDLNAGLVGPQMTYQRGKMNETLARYREFPVLLQGIDESKSFLAAENARRAGKNVTVDYQSTFSELMKYGNESVWRPQMTSLMSAKFDDAPEFYAMNGLVLGNLPTFEMCLNDRVIWYVYGQGDDPHSFHMHGNAFTHNGNRMTTMGISPPSPSSLLKRMLTKLGVIPGTMATLYMNATGAGKWQVICHTNEHVHKGMIGYYDVKTNCPKRD